MGKAIGICLILAGACSGVAAWYLGKKEKMHRMEDLLDFLRRAQEAVEQQTPMLYFLQSCSCRDVLLGKTLKCMMQELTANTWESGEEAWKAAIQAVGAGNGQEAETVGAGNDQEAETVGAGNGQGAETVGAGNGQEAETVGAGNGQEAETVGADRSQEPGSVSAGRIGEKMIAAAVPGWDMTAEQWEEFCSIGRIFDAGSKEAVLDILRRQSGKWEHFLEEERQQLARQQRVVLPVGMLSGLMLVLLLV